MITVENIEILIKMFTIHLCVYLLFYKITANKEKNIIALLISTVSITCIYLLLEYLGLDFAVRLIISALIYSILLGTITKNLIHYSVIATIISYAITLIVNTFAGLIIYLSISSLLNQTNQILCTYILTIFIVLMTLKVKRLDNGFSFLNNNSKLEILNVALFIISSEIILYFMILRKPIEELRNENLMSFFILISLFMGMLIFMCFRAYYKSIQTQKIIDNLNSDMTVKDDKYNKLYEEHQRVTKKLHETSHKVQALAYSMNTEFGEDNGDLKQQIEGLKEKLDKNSAIEKENLTKTNVANIDVMLSYMRSEALKNNIEFELKISDDIIYMVDNMVDRQDLEIMIADHIKDGIIAIKSKDNTKNKKILVQLGKFNEFYELSISDTGIEFEIDTLVNLGLKRITTHAETGGTGIGFMSTFETLQKYSGSLAIAEFAQTENNIYTKSVSIIFDNKNEYCIYSYRKDDIKLADEKNRIILK